MSSVKDLLKTNISTFKAPPRFPAGNYIVVIDSYEMYPFTWKTSGISGLSFVPKIHCLSSVEADDEANPELQEEQQTALDKYGDWTAKAHEFAYVAKETQKRMAAVSEINFPLLETDADHEEVMGILEKHAWRFYMNEDGTESGFVTDVLGLTFPEGTELGEVLEATVGKKFMVNFEYEPNSDPSRQPNFAIASVTQA